MQIFDHTNASKKRLLALGAESAGNFSFFNDGKIFYSADFGNLLEEANFATFKKAVLAFLKKNNVQPDIILTDLHPLMKTTLWAHQLAKKYQAQHIQIQHHHAHIFSAIGDCIINNGTCPVKRDSVFYGVAMDGTGYGVDGGVWGGEVFEITKSKLQKTNKSQTLKSKSSNEKFSIKRIGHLENQILLGGELAIQKPARMVISILSKFLPKEEIYPFIKKYYSAQEFEVLHNQLRQDFNCLETSSAGRVLDAVSLLLGFCENKRVYKHQPIDALEKNSTKPYADLKPKIIRDINGKYILSTTYLFNYVIKYLHKDKKRLAATAQLYLAEGLYEIIQKKNRLQTIFASGGIANNKIISEYFASKNILMNKKVPRGDAGLSFGQIIFYLLNE